MTANDILVLKCNLQGEETWRYTGQILLRSANAWLIEARFNRPDLPFHGIVLGENDRFVEIYYSDRWYNIFEVHDRQDDQIKAWYCNITQPALFTEKTISYVDLALDLLVFPDGRMLVLDEEEFAALVIDDATRRQARQALTELQQIFLQTDILMKGVGCLML